MEAGQETGVPCIDDASLRPKIELLTNVCASRKGRTPSAAKGMANADTVMTRLENGAVLKDALMPGASYEGWHSHCKLHPEWAARAKALVERNAEAGRARRLENCGVLRKRAQTHCSRGHALSKENTRLRTRNGRINRECKQCERERQKSRGAPLKPRTMLKVVRAMQQGVRFAALRKIVDVSAFYRTIRQVPDFAVVHHVWSTKGGADRMERVAVFHKNRKSTPKKRRSPKDPRGLPHPELVMEKLEGGQPLRIALRDTKWAGYQGFRSQCLIDPEWGAKANELVEKNAEAGRILKLTNLGVFRKRALRYCPRGHEYGDIKTPWSLDAPIGHDTDTRLVNTVSESLW
ncbi:hypothetical protein [Bradyrhizobium sp. UFLA05-112]